MADDPSTDPADVTIGQLRPEEGAVATTVAVRALMPTPMPSAAMGDLDEGKVRKMERAFLNMLTRQPGEVTVARSGERVVGVMRVVESPRCQPPAGVRLVKPLVMYVMMGRGASRFLQFRGEWRRRDPREHHLHLDPLAVEPGMQGRGIGSRLLTRLCETADARGLPAYLETDQEANVRLYSRFGFRVVDTTEIFGVTNYFMWRAPSAGDEA